MAEIHVQTKKRGMPGWLWIVLLLVILGAVAYVVTTRNNGTVKPNPTSQLHPSFKTNQHAEYLA